MNNRGTEWKLVMDVTDDLLLDSSVSVSSSSPQLALLLESAFVCLQTSAFTAVVGKLFAFILSLIIEEKETLKNVERRK